MVHEHEKDSNFIYFLFFIFQCSKEGVKDSILAEEESLIGASMESLNKSVENFPSDPKVYFHRALRRIEKDDFGNALKDLNQSLSLLPDNQEALSERAELHFILKNYEQALEDYNRLLELDSFQRSYYYKRSMVYFALGDKLESVYDYLLYYDKENFNKNVFPASEKKKKRILLKKKMKEFKNNHEMIAEDFDFPFGGPDAEAYRRTQTYGTYNSIFDGLHLGEDWNGPRKGNEHLGDPVLTIADGLVFYAEDAGSGWCNVVRILHKIKDKEGFTFVDSLYGHLQDMNVNPGDYVKKGQQIGTLGNCRGKWVGHIHWEIREKDLPIGGGYDKKVPKEFVHPTQFVKKHLKKK